MRHALGPEHAWPAACVCVRIGWDRPRWGFFVLSSGVFVVSLPRGFAESPGKFAE